MLFLEILNNIVLKSSFIHELWTMYHEKVRKNALWLLSLYKQYVLLPIDKCSCPDYYMKEMRYQLWDKLIDSLTCTLKWGHLILQEIMLLDSYGRVSLLINWPVNSICCLYSGAPPYTIKGYCTCHFSLG